MHNTQDFQHDITRLENTKEGRRASDAGSRLGWHVSALRWKRKNQEKEGVHQVPSPVMPADWQGKYITIWMVLFRLMQTGCQCSLPAPMQEADLDH